MEAKYDPITVLSGYYSINEIQITRRYYDDY